MKKFIEVEIVSGIDEEDSLAGIPDWENLGIEPPKLELTEADELQFKTIFLDPDMIEYFEGIFVLENALHIINLRTSSGKMMSAKVNDTLRNIISLR